MMPNLQPIFDFGVLLHIPMQSVKNIHIYVQSTETKICCPHKLCLIEGGQSCYPFINLLKTHCCVRSQQYIDGLVQERRNSIANALELRFSCTNPSICLQPMIFAITLMTLKSHFLCRTNVKRRWSRIWVCSPGRWTSVQIPSLSSENSCSNCAHVSWLKPSFMWDLQIMFKTTTHCGL